jgi:hypothetical protein
MAVPPMSQPDAWRMIRWRAAAAGSAAPIGCHALLATGITAYLSNGGALEHVPRDGRPREPAYDQVLCRTKGAAHQDGSGCEQSDYRKARPSLAGT